MWESPWQCWCPSFSSSASSTACKVFIYRHQHILIKEHYPTETDHTEMHGWSLKKPKYEEFSSVEQWKTWCQEWARKVSATRRIQEESVSADTMPGDHKHRRNAEEEDDEDKR